jgi:hypothetical protein
MDLGSHVENLQRHLAVALESGGDQGRSLTERLALPIEAAVRLTVQEAVASAVEEISCELAPGSVEVRLRGRDLEFIVVPPPAEPVPDDPQPPPVVEPDDGPVSRINLRLPDQLKGRVEQAAARGGLSVNAWLVRAAAAAVERGGPGSEHRRSVRTPQRFTGWAR